MKFFKVFSPQETFLIVCWAMYDLANQFFALNIISVYFPRWLTIEMKKPEYFYSAAFGFSMVLIAVWAPFLGTVSDRQGKKRIYLIGCTLLSVIFTVGMGTTQEVFPALVMFILANFGCQTAVVFYNAQLSQIAKPKYFGFVSGIGGIFAYSGALLTMALNKLWIEEWGYQATFTLTGIFFLIFALPAMVFIKEPPPREQKSLFKYLSVKEILKSFNRVKKNLTTGAKFMTVRLFLRAYFFALCAVQTMILFMSVYAAKIFKLNEADIIDLMIFSTFFSIAGSFVSSLVSDRIGKKFAMLGILGLWTLGILGGIFLKPPYQWVVGAIVGFAMASTWVVARAWAVEAVPKENIGELFGLFTLAGYAAGIVGPVTWTVVNKLLTPMGEWGYRLSLLSLLIFLGLAALDLIKIPDRQVPN